MEELKNLEKTIFQQISEIKVRRNWLNRIMKLLTTSTNALFECEKRGNFQESFAQEVIKTVGKSTTVLALAGVKYSQVVSEDMILFVCNFDENQMILVPEHEEYVLNEMNSLHEEYKALRYKTKNREAEYKAKVALLKQEVSLEVIESKLTYDYYTFSCEPYNIDTLLVSKFL